MTEQSVAGDGGYVAPMRLTVEQLADAVATEAFIADWFANPREMSAEHREALEAAQRKRDALYSDVVDDFTDAERAAVDALYRDDELEVGHEGIGGFAGGQAEATIRTLRKHGLTIARIGDQP